MTLAGLLMGPNASRGWRDWQFAAACAAGPLVWFVLAQGGLPLGDPAWIAQSPWRFIWLAVGAPVLEEMVFRGGLQPMLAQALAARESRSLHCGFMSSRVAANVLTSLVFAAMHLPTHAALWAASVFVPSLLFGHFRDRHHGVGSPMVLHAFYNAGYFLLFGGA